MYYILIFQPGNSILQTISVDGKFEKNEKSYSLRTKKQAQMTQESWIDYINTMDPISLWKHFFKLIKTCNDDLSYKNQLMHCDNQL